MSITLAPAGPWTAGQPLTASDGTEYEATGANTAKPYCAPIVIRGAAGPKGATGPDGPNGQPGQNGNDGVDAAINCVLSSDTRRVVFSTTDSAGTDGPCELDLDECCDDPPPPIPGVTIMKNCSPAGPHEVGDIVNYTFEVCNTGGENLVNVTVGDSVFGAIGTIASLAQGACQTLTYAHTVTLADLTTGNITNTATVTAQGDVSGDTASNTDNHTTPVVQTDAPGITLEKSCDPVGPYSLGQTVTYSFLVTNTGNVALTGVAVTDPGATGIPAIGNLAIGQSVTVTGTRVVTLADIVAGSFTNNATVTGTPPTGPVVTDTDDHTITTTQDPCIEIVKDCGNTGPYQEGDTVAYTFAVTNCGDVPLTGVVITDPGTTIPMPNIGNLAVGQTVTRGGSHVITAAEATAGSFTNTATVTGTPPSGPNVTDTDDHTVTTEVEVVCITRKLCGKVNAPFASFTDAGQPNIINDGVGGSNTWTYPNGVQVTVTHTGLVNNILQPVANEPTCGTAFVESANQTSTWSVSGLAAILNTLAVNGCQGCATIVPVHHSLDENGITVAAQGPNADAPVDPSETVNMPSSGTNQWTWSGGTDGEIGWFVEDVAADGNFYSVLTTMPNGDDVTRPCLGDLIIYRPVEVCEESCDGGNTWDFVSATDSNGNTYTEAQINY